MNTIYADTLKNGGGTFNLNGDSIPANEFVVALGRKFSAIVSADDESEFTNMLNSIMQIGYAKTIGTWVHENCIYIDLVECIPDKRIAIQLGIARNQIAIWDIANECEINTGGNGE